MDIHPFVDGNGRTARLLMNLILINKGYVAVSISPVLRFDYMQALQTAQRKSKPSDEAFVRLIAECEVEAQKDYFRMFRMPIPKKTKAGDDRGDRYDEPYTHMGDVVVYDYYHAEELIKLRTATSETGPRTC